MLTEQTAELVVPECRVTSYLLGSIPPMPGLQETETDEPAETGASTSGAERLPVDAVAVAAPEDVQYADAAEVPAIRRVSTARTATMGRAARRRIRLRIEPLAALMVTTEFCWPCGTASHRIGTRCPARAPPSVPRDGGTSQERSRRTQGAGTSFSASKYSGTSWRWQGSWFSPESANVTVATPVTDPVAAISPGSGAVLIVAV